MAGMSDGLPSFHTERLRLRPVVLEDAPALLAMSDARAPGTWIGYAPLADLEAAQVFAAWMVMVGRKPVPDICWAIERRDVPGLIGLCQLKGWDPVERTAQVGYEIARTHQRHGFMREALEALLRGCFQGFGLRHLDAHVHADNAASLALLRHAGFVLQGELPGGETCGGTTHAMQVWRRCAEAIPGGRDGRRSRTTRGRAARSAAPAPSHAAA